MPKQKKFRPQQELITEFISVIQRPKLKSYFKGIDIDHLMALLMHYGILIQVTSTINICRDRKDNFQLALADDSKANYLITGDKDLLSFGVGIKPSDFNVSLQKVILRVFPKKQNGGTL